MEQLIDKLVEKEIKKDSETNGLDDEDDDDVCVDENDVQEKISKTNSLNESSIDRKRFFDFAIDNLIKNNNNNNNNNNNINEKESHSGAKESDGKRKQNNVAENVDQRTMEKNPIEDRENDDDDDVFEDDEDEVDVMTDDSAITIKTLPIPTTLSDKKNSNSELSVVLDQG
ncbi:hypothetical protein SSS_09220 [Sarcoptes scabiei]|uniref:Uncharacterized protein n=1 Tax=Sarcoptes scabiei TaxID=52283 RepID=A0A834RHE8_SARSC|nr:hypothetical protein SSS_09220 [Sarcoptes scabiei]